LSKRVVGEGRELPAEGTAGLELEHLHEAPAVRLHGDLCSICRGLAGFNPPLHEGDLPTGGRKFRSGGGAASTHPYQFQQKTLHFTALCTLVQSAVLRSHVVRLYDVGETDL